MRQNLPGTDQAASMRNELRAREVDRKQALLSAQAAVAPLGLIGSVNRRDSNGRVGLSSSGWTPLLGLSVPINAFRSYLVSARLGTWVDGGANGEVEVAITYTTDGTTAGQPSPSLIHGGTTNLAGGYVSTVALDEYLVPTTDGTLSLWLGAMVVLGSTGGAYGQNFYDIWMGVEDKGAAINNVGIVTVY